MSRKVRVCFLPRGLEFVPVSRADAKVVVALKEICTGRTTRLAPIATVASDTSHDIL